MAWVPYAELYPQFGFASSLKELPALLEQMTHIPPSTWARMEAKATEMRESHFTLEGVMEQIQLFMQPNSGAKSGRRSDLRCQAFTFIRSHAGQRRPCWLKGAGFHLTVTHAQNVVSGVLPDRLHVG